MESQPTEGALSPALQRAKYRADWDARLLPMLTTEWQSANAIAARLNEPQPRVLERLKDLAARELAERRIHRVRPPQAGQPAKKRKKRPRVHVAQFEALFRLPPAP